MLRAAAPILGAVGVLLAPIEMEAHARSALAIAVAMIVAWLVEFLHPGMVGFIGSFLFVATGDVEFETAFAGFATTTPWFLYGTLLLVATATGAGVIDWLRARSPEFLTRSTPAAAAALIAIAYLLAFVVPSSVAKATLLALLALAWSRSIAPLLAATYGAIAFGHAGLPGWPTAIIGWDVGVAIALVAATVVLARDAVVDAQAPADERPAIGLDWKVALVVVVAAALWITAPLHRATPELVGLAAGLACSLPGIGRAGAHGKLTADPLALIFAGTALSIPAVLVETKAADVLARLWLTTNESAGMLPNNLVAYWSTTIYRLFSPDSARVALPALDGIATPLGSAAVWAYAGSTLLSLHQSPALALAMSVGGCRARHVLVAGVLVLVAGSIVVMIF
jgi:hypothetical protein